MSIFLLKSDGGTPQNTYLNVFVIIMCSIHCENNIWTVKSAFHPGSGSCFFNSYKIGKVRQSRAGYVWLRRSGIGICRRYIPTLLDLFPTCACSHGTGVLNRDMQSKKHQGKPSAYPDRQTKRARPWNLLDSFTAHGTACWWANW